MSTAKMILEYWVGWQLLDGLRGYLSGVWHRSSALYRERHPTMRDMIERNQSNG